MKMILLRSSCRQLARPQLVLLLLLLLLLLKDLWGYYYSYCDKRKRSQISREAAWQGKDRRRETTQKKKKAPQFWSSSMSQNLDSFFWTSLKEKKKAFLQPQTIRNHNRENNCCLALYLLRLPLFVSTFFFHMDRSLRKTNGKKQFPETRGVGGQRNKRMRRCGGVGKRKETTRKRLCSH
jgi:hypothetical protein